jgi:hypothetical protein
MLGGIKSVEVCLDHSRCRGLLIEGLVRIVDWSGYKNAGKRELSSGHLFYFVLRELTSTHPAEYPVLIVVVRHRSLLSVFSIFFSKHTGEIHGRNKTWINRSTKTTELIVPIQLGFQSGTQHPAKKRTPHMTLITQIKNWPRINAKEANHILVS